MKRGAKIFFTVLIVPAVGALLLGCPKKVVTTDATPEPRVSETVGVARPKAPSPGAAEDSAAKQLREKQLEDQRAAQLLASRGEDIPIKEGPTVAFVEPAPEDRATLKPIYFEYNKSNIRPEYQPALEKISKWMAARAEQQLLIEGHCDERGTDEYNLALGERRALAVRRYLVALGISVERVHTISYGEEKPAVPGSDESAWSKNRRVEFKVSAQ